MDQEVFKTGESGRSVVRIGDTVRKETGPNHEFVQTMMSYLNEKNFQYTPKLLGNDDQGREVWEFVPGENAVDVYSGNNKIATQAISIMKEFHSLTSPIATTEGQEVLVHGDFSPWNFISRDGSLICLIDYDDCHFGTVAEDLANALWTFLDLGSDVNLTDEYIKQIGQLTSAYGYSNGEEFVSTLLEIQNKVLEERQLKSKNSKDRKTQMFNVVRSNLIINQINWVNDNKEEIISAVGN